VALSCVTEYWCGVNRAIASWSFTYFSLIATHSLAIHTGVSRYLHNGIGENGFRYKAPPGWKGLCAMLAAFTGEVAEMASNGLFDHR
jgi:hypothetical protein